MTGGAAASCDAATQAAAAIAVARHRYGTAKAFAAALGLALDGRPLTRQAIYLWESGANRVPAAALLIAAELVGTSVQDLLAAGIRFSTKGTDQLSAPRRTSR